MGVDVSGKFVQLGADAHFRAGFDLVVDVKPRRRIAPNEDDREPRRYAALAAQRRNAWLDAFADLAGNRFSIKQGGGHGGILVVVRTKLPRCPAIAAFFSLGNREASITCR